MAVGRGSGHAALTATQMTESKAAIGVDFGTHASTGALETAWPAASHRGARAWIGGAQYVSDGTSWVLSPVSALVTGPASATDKTLPRFNGVTGKIVQTSGVVIGDNNDLSNYYETRSTQTTGGNITLTMAAPVQHIVMGGNHQITGPSAPVAGIVGSLVLHINCAGFTPTWGTNISLGSAGAPTLTTTSGHINELSLMWSQSLSKWMLAFVRSYS